jgi:uncharacterized protein DUF6518
MLLDLHTSLAPSSRRETNVEEMHRRSAGRLSTASDLARSVAAGLGLGLYSRLGDLAPRPLAWVANLGAPWLVVAAIVGARSTSRSSGALTGGLALGGAACTHYLSVRAYNGASWPALFARPLVAWAMVGVCFGSFFGWAGRRAREDPDRALGPVALLLGACLAAEACYLCVSGESNAWKLAVPLELISAIALPTAVAGLEPKRMAVWATAMLPVVGLGLAVLRALDLWLNAY